MKKILLLLLTVLTFTCCSDGFRRDDFFIVISKENGNTSYKYMYGVNHYMITTTERGNAFFLDDYYFISNENYELGDTIKFTRHAFTQK